MTQIEILKTIYDAKDPKAIREAKEKLAQYLKQHPNDHEVRGTAELLIRTEQVLKDE